MLVRDEILVSRPANGGMDCPLVFELDAVEQQAVIDYLAGCFPKNIPCDLLDAAYRLAERGIPQGITELVKRELIDRGRWDEAKDLEPFVEVGVK